MKRFILILCFGLLLLLPFVTCVTFGSPNVIQGDPQSIETKGKLFSHKNGKPINSEALRETLDDLLDRVESDGLVMHIRITTIEIEVASGDEYD